MCVFFCSLLTICLIFYTQKVHADSAPWYNSSWTHRTKITIDHTKVPNTDQAYFPVLINGTNTNWKTTGNG